MFSLSVPQDPHSLSAYLDSPSHLWETLSLSQGLHLPLPTLITFPGFSASHENASPSTPLYQDPHLIPESGVSLPPSHFPCLTLPSLFYGVSRSIHSPSTPSRILPAPQTFCVQLGDPPPTHTHTCFVSVPRVPPRVLQGYHRPPWSPSPCASDPPSNPFLGGPGVPLNPSPCSLAKPPSPWPLFTRTRAS